MEKIQRTPSKARLLWELFSTFFKIGLFTFGGGYAMISIIQRETVERRGWVTDEDIMNMIIIAESTPGVIAVNSATFVGYKVAGLWGGIIATLGVVLPSFIIIVLISLFYNEVRENRYVAAAFRGIRCAVVVLIFNAVRKLGKQIDINWYNLVAVAVVFVVSAVTSFDVIYLILIGGAIGIAVTLIASGKNKLPAEQAEKENSEKTSSDNANNAETSKKQKKLSAKSNAETSSDNANNADGNANNDASDGKGGAK